VTRDRIVPVVLSVAVIVAVALLQARSRTLAALLAAMPLTAPLAMWIVFAASDGDHRQLDDDPRTDRHIPFQPARRKIK